MVKKIAIVAIAVLGLFAAWDGGVRSNQSFPLFENAVSDLSPSGVPVIERALVIISRRYYDQGRVVPAEMLKSGMKAIAAKLPDFLVVFSDGDKKFRIEVGSAVKSYSYAELRSPLDLVPIFAEAFARIEQEKVLEREHLEKDELEYAVCEGILNTLDPHSSVLSPEVLKEFQAQTEGEFGGVGLVVGMRDGLLTVISPLAGTPASRAGIQAGDAIRKIGGEPTLNMPLSEAVEKLRGREGTVVKIVFDRKGRGEFAVALRREKIQIESIQSTLVMSGEKAIGYLRVKGFQKDTYNDLVAHLNALKSRAPTGGLDGLILDLRNNPGGLLEQAIKVSDLFLARGPIVMTVGTGGHVEDISMAQAIGTEPLYPIVVLANEGSASAAEIVAAALKENERALVIGDTTFGKGSVQSVLPLGEDAAIKMTIAEYWTAGRHSIQSVGVTPDLHLFPMKVSAKWKDLIPNEGVNESDLEKHLESTHTSQEKPRYHLSYFDDKFFKEASKEDEDGDKERQLSPEEAKKEYGREAHIDDDYWVTLAKNILSFYKGEADSDAADPQLSAWIAKMQKAEDGKIAAALKQLRVDWEAQLSKAAQAALPAAGKNPLKLRTFFRQYGKPVDVLQAGQPVMVDVEATNTGKTPLYQVLAVAGSLNKHFIFDDKEFVFGRVNPGQTVFASVEVKLPPTLPTFIEPITYHIYSGLERKIGEAKARYAVAASEKPRFSFSYAVVDKASTASPLSGNGAIDAGERVELKMKIKNEGNRVAEEVQVNIKDLSGKDITLENGRQDLGVLKPGEEKKAVLSFSVSPTVVDKELALDLFVTDSKSEEALNSRLSFALARKDGVLPPPGVWHRPPEVVISRVIPSGQGSPEGQARSFKVEGSFFDADGIRDLQAFVGDDKQYLYVAGGEKKRIDFSVSLTTVPSDKTRFFFLVGRDRDGITEHVAHGIPLATPAVQAMADAP